VRVIVRELWRYPVKSMGGQRVPAVDIDERGIHADRLWAVRDLKIGAATTARRLPVLMQCSARFAEEPPAQAGPGHAVEVIVTFPDGEELSSGDPAIHARLSDLVGRDVELFPLPAKSDKRGYRGPLLTQTDFRRQFDIPEGEPLPDISMFPVSKLAQLAVFATPVGTFADAYPLHLLTTGSLDAMRAITPSADFDVRRFRPNVLLEGNDEFSWCGGTLSGAVELEPAVPTIRCSMPTRQQVDLPADADIIRTVKHHRDRCLGVYANVTRGGRLAEGDDLQLTRGGPPGVAARASDRLRRGVIRAGMKVLPRGRAL
jgi:uncharacterized protein YcbX